MIHKQTYWSTEYILAKCLPLTENSQSKASLSCHSLHISTCSINGNKANLSVSLPFCSSLIVLCSIFFVYFELIFSLLSMSASATQHLHAPVDCHSSLSHSVCDSSSCKQCLWKVSMLFYFFGLIPNASVLLFFFGFILMEWYFCVWCNTMKTYIINRLHHGFKEYCCFVYH